MKNITPNICKAARALAQMTQKDVASQANIATQTLADFERGARIPHHNNLAAIEAVFEDRGIEFIFESDEVVGLRFLNRSLHES